MRSQAIGKRPPASARPTSPSCRSFPVGSAKRRPRRRSALRLWNLHARTCEADAQTVASCGSLMLKGVCEGAQQADAAPADCRFATGVDQRHLRREQGIEGWREVFNGEEQLPFAQPGELDGHRLGGVRRIAVADDVGDHLLQAKMYGEMKLIVDAITRGESLHPLREAGGLRESAAKNDTVDHFAANPAVVGVHRHACPMLCHCSAATAVSRSLYTGMTVSTALV